MSDDVPDFGTKWPTDPPKGYPGVTEEPTFDHEIADADTDVPSRGYEERWRSVARMHAAGVRSNVIARKLNYTDTRISLLLKHPWITAEVERFRKSYDTDVMARVKDAALDGINRIHEIIRDPGAKTSDALHASIFAVEKSTGKATQQVDIRDNSLAAFMELARSMKRSGETLDLPPAHTEREALPAQEAAPASAGWDGWLDSNL